MKFEYKVLKRDASAVLAKINLGEVEEELNKLGTEGWELTGISTDIKVGSTRAIGLYLKRPIS